MKINAGISKARKVATELKEEFRLVRKWTISERRLIGNVGKGYTKINGNGPLQHEYNHVVQNSGHYSKNPITNFINWFKAFKNNIKFYEEIKKGEVPNLSAKDLT